MAQFARAFGHEGAASRALKCAMCECLRGGRRQVHGAMVVARYDAPAGRVADGYPVLVHQHAMAPMTLLGLGEVIQQDFTPWISK